MTTVVSYSYNIPERIEYNDYLPIANPDCEKYQEAYDGTMIAVYNYEGVWHFGTSSCTDVNASKFPHPIKSHGNMLDEVLMKQFNSQFSQDELSIGNEAYVSSKLRKLFTDNLDPVIAYEFVLLHYENVHIINYTDLLGAEYKELVHINSKNRLNHSELDITTSPLQHIGMKYPKYYSNINDAMISISITNTYGFIVKQFTNNGVSLYKISPNHITIKEETDPCNPNVWQNMLIVYMKNRQDYKVSDYISTYVSDLTLPVDEMGREIDPTYIIHTMISTIKDILFNLYNITTVYDVKTNKFKINKELDQKLPPILRFHLAQLRHRQVTVHSRNMLKAGQVYYYICHCNNVKNIKLLVNYFASCTGYNIPDKASMCINILNMVL